MTPRDALIGAAAGALVTACSFVMSFDDYGTTNGARYWHVGGTARGLDSSEATLMLGDERLVVHDGAFAFNTPFDDGASYEVTMATQPPLHTCTVDRPRGTIAHADVSLDVHCLSSDATLSTLLLSNASIAPSFTTATLKYTSTVRAPGFLTGIPATTSVLAVPVNSRAALTLDGAPLLPGQPSPPRALGAGHTTLNVAVTSEDATAKAAYIIDVDQRLADYIKAPINVTASDFGLYVAMSGSTLVVAAPNEPVGAPAASDAGAPPSSFGALYIYLRGADGTWTQQARLPCPAGVAVFGFGAAISGDTLAVGARVVNNGPERGEVHVYTRSGAQWSHETALAVDTGGAPFWGPLVLDGDSLAVTTGSLSGSFAAGAVQVYARNATGWSLQAILTGPSDADAFGASLALAGDTIAIGAPTDSRPSTGVGGTPGGGDASSSGAAYIFVRAAGVWSQQELFKAPTIVSYSRYGTAVGISGDTLVVGRATEYQPHADIEGAFVYRRTGSTWTTEAELVAPNAASQPVGTKFGAAVAVNGDVIAIGAPYDSSDALGIGGDATNMQRTQAGAVHVFRRAGGSWSPTTYVKPLSATSSSFGSPIALTSDALVVGVDQDSSDMSGINPPQGGTSAFRSGAAYVY